MSQPPPGKDEGYEDSTMPSLTAYLTRTKRLVLPGLTRGTVPKSSSSDFRSKTILVMGNPSADLDSFISAVTTAYFYDLKAVTNSTSKTYIPILNLPSVKATDLWRLRPEFGVAVRLALGESIDTINANEVGEQGKTPVLEQLVTIADIKNDETSPLHGLFLSSGSQDPQDHTSHYEDETTKQPFFLVDHNAPSIPGLSDETISSTFTVTGCIDHHVDENYVSQSANPRIITIGIGSCTSLVVQHLRDQGLWPTTSSSSSTSTEDLPVLNELSRLALAPILIDTSNLQATGDKCSDLDRATVTFLESIIKEPSQVSSQTSNSTKQCNRTSSHKAISTAKANSLNLLSMQEIFDRDYKSWTERTSSSSKEITIGISSLVKPLSWLADHVGGAQALVDEICAFATSQEKQLGVFCMLTRTGDGRKEVAIVGFDEDVEDLSRAFEDEGEELKLEKWDESPELKQKFKQRFGDDGQWKIWFMGDTSKSRKQVGPLLREAVKKT